MRTTPIDRHLQKDFWKLIGHWSLVIICILVFGYWLSGCATTGPRKAFKKFPPKVQKIETEKGPGVEKEIIKSEPPPIAASTPKARAANKMIEDGRRFLSMGDVEAAERIFQDAINVDPSNGVAYYYLARTKYELGQFQQAAGILDKAEELLSGSREWTETVRVLRSLVNSQSG